MRCDLTKLQQLALDTSSTPTLLQGGRRVPGPALCAATPQTEVSTQALGAATVTMAKRGMSLEEKRRVMLEVFHDTKDVYTLKDVEKFASKRGVVLQSVKEVLQGLVDDDMVHQERIGASNYFWSFPSETAVKMETNIKKKTDMLQDKRQQAVVLRKQIADSSRGKEDSEERALAGTQLQALERKGEALDAELAQYADNDPERIELMRSAAAMARDAANRWLDNCYALQTYLSKQYEGMEEGLDNLWRQEGLETVDYIVAKD